MAKDESKVFYSKNILFTVTICPGCGKGRLKSGKYTGGELTEFFKILAENKVRLIKIRYRECEEECKEKN